jgi:hypothetical protein
MALVLTVAKSAFGDDFLGEFSPAVGREEAFVALGDLAMA